MFRTGKSWATFQCYLGVRMRLYCASKNSNGGKTARDIGNVRNCDKADSSVSNYHEMYQQLDKLDFSTAAKILFTEPPNKKKFGFDFHLVQFFFACMPSLAVFLVAQYSRYEMRKMEAELEEEEEKKQEEEEEKAKAMESKAAEENEADPQRELKEVKMRLEKLEETLKGIVVEAKPKSSTTSSQNQESSKENRVSTDPGISTDGKPNVRGGITGNSDPDPVSSQGEQKNRTQDERPPQNTKR